MTSAGDRVLDLIRDLVRQSLASGRAVEIEGLGTFRSSGQGGVEFEPEGTRKVFLAYVEEDLRTVRRLAAALRDHGWEPWLDREKLMAGENWTQAIERAIEVSDAFVACFSKRSVAKHSQFQAEVRWALRCARRRPLDQAFVVPVRIEDCVRPARIARRIQFVDLYPDWDAGIERLLRALGRIRAAPG